MRIYLTPLLFFQRFFLPALLILLAWALWRTLFKKDLGVGLALYLALVIVVDGYLNTGIFLPGLEKGSIRYSEVCAGFLLLHRPSVSRRTIASAATRFFVGLYFLLLFLSMLRSDPLLTGFLDFRIRIVPQIVAFTIALRGLRETEDYRRFLCCLAILSVVAGLFVFWDLFFDRWLIASQMLFKAEYWANRKHGRFGSFFLNPNYLAAFTVLVFPAVFVWVSGEKEKLRKLCGWAGLLALFFCLVETQSRGPLLAFCLVIPLLVLGPAGDMSRVRRIGIALAFFAVFAVLMPGFFAHAAERFSKLDQESEEGRTRATVWQYTQQIIADHPLAGIGFGEQQFLDVMEEYGFEQRFGEQSLDNPHNSYLQMTVYAGFPALFAFVFANAVLLIQAARSILGRVAGEQTKLAFGLAVGLVGFLVAIYPDMHMFTQTVAPVYWVFFGLLLSVTTTAPEAVPAAVLSATSRWTRARQSPRGMVPHQPRPDWSSVGARGKGL